MEPFFCCVFVCVCACINKDGISHFFQLLTKEEGDYLIQASRKNNLYVKDLNNVDCYIQALPFSATDEYLLWKFMDRKAPDPNTIFKILEIDEQMLKIEKKRKELTLLYIAAFQEKLRELEKQVTLLIYKCE